MDRLRARWLLALALVAAGVAVGVLGAFVYSLTENKVYRARTSLIAQVGTRPVAGGVLRTIRNLVDTGIVAQNVIRNQNLTETSAQFDKRLHVSTAGSVITVDLDAGSQAEAVRLAQELSLVFTQLVRDRFGGGADAAAVTIFDPAHGVGNVSPRVGRELGWGALFGGLLGLLAANVLVLRGRPGVWTPVPYYYEELPALGAATPPCAAGRGTAAVPRLRRRRDRGCADRARRRIALPDPPRRGRRGGHAHSRHCAGAGRPRRADDVGAGGR